jgi:dienelactone hydrolase
MAAFLLYPMRFIRTRAAKDSVMKDGSWPVVLFSHGLCGTRTMYSALCTELASHGYFVVAPEHTDGSACLAVTDGRVIPYASHAQASRAKQLQQRVVELESCWQALPGLGVNFGNCLDLSKCILMGHSFGGAAVVCAASADSFRTRSSLVLLDPWLGPAMNIFKSVHMSTLIIMQGSSMLWSGNASDIVQLLKVVDAKSQPAFFTEVLGARHQDASDVPFFLHAPLALLCASSMTRTGHWVWQRNSELIQQFLSFANEDVDMKVQRLSSISGVRVHDWKSWLQDQKRVDGDLQITSNPAAGA